MKYRNFSPTSFDHHGLGLPDRQDWIVAPVGTNRDADALTRSNWEVVISDIESHDSGEDVEIHRFGHWGCGWFEIALIRPNTPASECAAKWESSLSDYPVADDSHFSEIQHEEAQEVWKTCYSEKERIEIVRENRDDFVFNNLTDMLSCIRGEFYSGTPHLLLD